jgi:hypothetical protein
MNRNIIIFLSLSFIFFFFFNGYVDLSNYQIDKVYLTISTFLFSVFNGFFISRQSNRYTEIRNNLSRFDADMSIIFRESTHLSKEEHDHMTSLIREYYETVLKHHDWSYYYFTHKTTLISSLHKCLQAYAKHSIEGLRGEAIKNMLHTLDDVQITRKLLVSLKEETIPYLQQVFMYMLAGILFVSILTLPSVNLVLASMIKAIYIITVFTVAVLLKKFDDLTLFEGSIGEHSARDVLNIIDGDK